MQILRRDCRQRDFEHCSSSFMRYVNSSSCRYANHPCCFWIYDLYDLLRPSVMDPLYMYHLTPIIGPGSSWTPWLVVLS